MTTKTSKHGTEVATCEPVDGLTLRLWSNGTITGPVQDRGGSSEGENADGWHESFYDRAVALDRDANDRQRGLGTPEEKRAEAAAIARALLLHDVGSWEESCVANLRRMSLLDVPRSRYSDGNITRLRALASAGDNDAKDELFDIEADARDDVMPDSGDDDEAGEEDDDGE